MTMDLAALLLRVFPRAFADVLGVLHHRFNNLDHYKLNNHNDNHGSLICQFYTTSSSKRNIPWLEARYKALERDEKATCHSIDLVDLSNWDMSSKTTRMFTK
mmetsp:Transcript_6403/g.18010  ORF Transcript_6403/g.18010 Transcript_6403/m.18010 type:complete len:102 (-) Transcript_6403:2360-2665(-)